MGSSVTSPADLPLIRVWCSGRIRVLEIRGQGSIPWSLTNLV